jgi:hypothetical protein
MASKERRRPKRRARNGAESRASGRRQRARIARSDGMPSGPREKTPAQDQAALSIEAHRSRWTVVRLMIAGAGIIAVLMLDLGITLRVAGVSIAANNGSSRLVAPPWLGDSAACRQNPMAHVHDPTRLVLIAKCSTVSGTVKDAHLNPQDGDLLVNVILDATYQRFLTPESQGVLRVEVIPTDQPAVQAPKPGQHATFYGAWISERFPPGVDVEMHPCWKIELSEPPPEPTSAPASTLAPGVAPDQSLSVKINAPESVRRGAPITVSVFVESLLQKAPKPAQAVALYVEVAAYEGTPVEWKAASTSSLGVASIRLVANGPPGDYIIWVYAHKGIQGGTGKARLSVTRP